MHFDTLAPNIQVKVPATEAGITAAEEVTYRGLNLNATVCFTIPQAIAIAEAVERGLKSAKGGRQRHFHSYSGLHLDDRPPGRLDESSSEKTGSDISFPATWTGRESRPSRKRTDFSAARISHAVLAAAYRHHLHWSELIGGDIVMTIPYEWQRPVQPVGLGGQRTNAGSSGSRNRFGTLYVSSLISGGPMTKTE